VVSTEAVSRPAGDFPYGCHGGDGQRQRGKRQVRLVVIAKSHAWLLPAFE
jgi:hypothetical protein